MFSWRINLFSDKINIKKVSEPFYFPAVRKKFRYKDSIFPQTLFTYCIFINEPLMIYKQESLSAGRENLLFLTVKCRKKFMLAQPLMRRLRPQYERQHVLFKVTQLLPYLVTLDELRAICHAVYRRPLFWRQIGRLETQNVHIFHFLQSDMVLAIVIPFSLIFNAISSEKSRSISVHTFPVNSH